MKKIRKAVIPAAGYGTRFLPATKAQPKEMLTIVDKPVIQYIVEEAVASGIEQIVIITGQTKRPIEDHFDRSFELEYRLQEQGKLQELEELRRISDLAEFVYVRQKEPLGNGHAVLCARDVVGNEPFAVMWADDIVDAEVPCLKQLMAVHDKYRCSVMAVMPVPEDQTPQYGVIAGTPVEERVYRVTGLVEKPEPGTAPSNLAAVKEYILMPEIFEILSETAPGKGGEIWLSDALLELTRRQAVYAYEFEGKRYDAGNKLGLLKAIVEFALKRPEFNGEFRSYLAEKLEEYQPV